MTARPDPYLAGVLDTLTALRQTALMSPPNIQTLVTQIVDAVAEEMRQGSEAERRLAPLLGDSVMLVSVKLTPDDWGRISAAIDFCADQFEGDIGREIGEAGLKLTSQIEQLTIEPDTRSAR